MPGREEVPEEAVKALMRMRVAEMFTDWKITVERPDGERYWFINQGDQIEDALANARTWTTARIVGCDLLPAASSEEPHTNE